MDNGKVEAWLEAYREAWKTNDPERVGALFAEDARYLTSPFDDPWEGRAQIVESWTEETDEDEEFELQSEVLATNDRRAVVRCRVIYWNPDRSETQEEFSTIWLIDFDAEDRCREFTEWYMERPKPPL